MILKINFLKYSKFINERSNFWKNLVFKNGIKKIKNLGNFF
jgi:hypothetical protein